MGLHDYIDVWLVSSSNAEHGLNGLCDYTDVLKSTDGLFLFSNPRHPIIRLIRVLSLPPTQNKLKPIHQYHY